MDLAVEYHGAWNIIEVKLLRQGKSFEGLAEEGKRQTLRYRDSFPPAFVPPTDWRQNVIWLSLTAVLINLHGTSGLNGFPVRKLRFLDVKVS
jgi:hypothetical protein